jgi:hypothetical protein
MFHFPYGLGLNLADPFPRKIQVLFHLLKGVVVLLCDPNRISLEPILSNLFPCLYFFDSFPIKFFFYETRQGTPSSRILHPSHFGRSYPPSLSNPNSSCVAVSRKNSASFGLKGSPFTSKTGIPFRVIGYSVVNSPETGSPSKVLNFKKPSFPQEKRVFSLSFYLFT